MTRAALLLGCLLLVVACNSEEENDIKPPMENASATHGDMMDTLTIDEAGARAEKHVHHAIAALPVDPTLTPKYSDPAECLDPTDDGPQGRYEVARKYWLDDIPQGRNSEFVDTLYNYWSRNGYHVRTDKRSSSDKFVSVEDESDSFIVSVQQSVEGDLSLGASSPCVWPDGAPPYSTEE